MFGQEGISDAEITTDSRGVIDRQQAARIRATRAQEPWERYDSIVIGPGAAAKTRGWFNTWADFANSDQLQWFSGRDSAVGPAYTNQSTERTDWAQDIYQSLVEFICPTVSAEFASDNNDSAFSPVMFSQILPNQLSMRVVLADADEIAKAPASHFPSGFGTSYPLIAGAATPSMFGGNSGEPVVSNGWKWVEPIMLAAKSKLTVFGNIDAPIRDLLRNMPGPGNLLIPNGAGGVITYPLWYTIRVTHRGPRYLQLRGARSSS
jgi:hypothetical protein